MKEVDNFKFTSDNKKKCINCRGWNIGGWCGNCKFKNYEPNVVQE